MTKKDCLDNLAKNISVCQKCPLYKDTTNSVPGDGDPESGIMLIGEAPGYYEDQQGLPFVGRSGQFLNVLLLRAGLSRPKVWIGNVLKHRPPENRDPLPEELSACEEWIDKQIEVLKPRVIVTLGRFSMAKFIPDGKITLIHGKKFEVNWKNEKITVVPMFHPAAGLRATGVAKMMEADFVKLKNEFS